MGVVFNTVDGGGYARVVVNEVDVVDGAADGSDREMVEMVMVKTQPAQGPAQLLYPSYVQAPTMLGCSELSKFVRIRKLPHATKRTERSSTRGSFSITDGAKSAVARL